jgi:hypothetical protein
LGEGEIGDVRSEIRDEGSGFRIHGPYGRVQPGGSDARALSSIADERQFLSGPYAGRVSAGGYAAEARPAKKPGN